MTHPAPLNAASQHRPSRWSGPFLKACRGEPTPITPIWLMRQAGRYMPEYRAVRQRVGFLELCNNPELATEVTITAQQRLGVDAAILFADILLILQAMGLPLEFTTGDGPVLSRPVRTPADVAALRRPVIAEALGPVIKAVGLIRRGLAENIPLIGFAGAPFTVASYAIEGGGSRHYERTKALMHGHPHLWDDLMTRLAQATADYLLAQIAAGADAVQLFDSWVGCLSPADYHRFVAPYTAAVIAAMPREVPVLHFGTGNPALLTAYRQAGGDVIGVDFRIELDAAWKLLDTAAPAAPEMSAAPTAAHKPACVAVQGNLDPAILLAERSVVLERAADVMTRAAGRSGHIFNLGHGLLPTTPVDNVLALVEAVHSHAVR